MDNNHNSDKKGWWFIEIWDEKRDIFKALVEHVFAFILLITILVLFHFLFDFIHLPPEYTKILKLVDFGGILLALIIFTLSFLYRLFDDAITTAKEKKEARELLKSQMREIIVDAVGYSDERIDDLVRQEIYKMQKSANKIKN